METNKGEELYKACMKSKHVGSEFTITELTAFKITDDAEELRVLCQDLLDRHLFVPYLKRGITSYRTRSVDVALKLAKLTGEVLMIFNAIGAAGRSGIWKKTLSEKTNLHDMTIVKGIKELSSKQLIKEFKTSKNATKRMYILYDLDPSEESTGGTFYKDGELDEGLVTVLSVFILNEIEARSWAVSKPSLLEKGKRGAIQPSTLFPEHFFQVPKTGEGMVLVPHSESYDDYPTASEIWNKIEEEELIKDMEFPPDAVQRLINMLIYDGQVQEVSPGKYRSVRRLRTETNQTLESTVNPRPGPQDLDDYGYGVGTGLNGVPCDRCPVAKDCRPGGIVSPEKCVYMERWIKELQF